MTRTLHPEIARILATLPAPPDGPLDPVAMRAAEEALVSPVADRLALYEVHDTVVQTDAADVPVRVYTPTKAESHGVIVYLHGGAFFLGSLNTHDHVARTLASETGCKVVSVGYRLAPEHPFPAGLSDCYAVVKWVAHSGDSLAWDHQTPGARRRQLRCKLRGCRRRAGARRRPAGNYPSGSLLPIARPRF